MAIGRGQRDIAQPWRFKPIGILKRIAFPHAAHIARHWIKTPSAPRAKSGQAQRVELLIAQQRTAVA